MPARKRALGYVGGCAAALVGLYNPPWVESSSAFQDPFTFMVHLFVFALGLCGSLAGGLVARATAAHTDPRAWWLMAAQGLAATYVPVWVTMEIGFGLGFPLFPLLLLGTAFASAGACWLAYAAVPKAAAR